jgi:hypothetical protein
MDATKLNESPIMGNELSILSGVIVGVAAEIPPGQSRLKNQKRQIVRAILFILS